MSLNHGKIWWSELIADDVDAAVAFYGEVCGWAFDPMPMEEGVYHVAIAHGEPVAGITGRSGMEDLCGDSPRWCTYVAVDDVEASVAATEAAGGTVLRPPFDVPDTGRIAIVRDPAGALVGLMTPAFPLDDTVARDTAEELSEDEDDDLDENFPV